MGDIVLGTSSSEPNLAACRRPDVPDMRSVLALYSTTIPCKVESPALNKS